MRGIEKTRFCGCLATGHSNGSQEEAERNGAQFFKNHYSHVLPLPSGCRFSGLLAACISQFAKGEV